MPKLVFIHGPGAGACSDAFVNQLDYFPDSLAPDLPGHLEGTRCLSVERYTDWVRGWIWAHGAKSGLILCGYTLGASIALQYGLDYPDEVAGLILMTVAMRPKVREKNTYQMRLDAVENKKSYQEWIDFQVRAMHAVPKALRRKLLQRHKQVGPVSQYHDLKAIDCFDVRDRIASLRPKLLLIRGLNDHGNPPNYETEIHKQVPGSQYIELKNAGHFPTTEAPSTVNPIIEKFVATL